MEYWCWIKCFSFTPERCTCLILWAFQFIIRTVLKSEEFEKRCVWMGLDVWIERWKNRAIALWRRVSIIKKKTFGSLCKKKSCFHHKRLTGDFYCTREDSAGCRLEKGSDTIVWQILVTSQKLNTLFYGCCMSRAAGWSPHTQTLGSDATHVRLFALCFWIVLKRI